MYGFSTTIARHYLHRASHRHFPRLPPDYGVQLRADPLFHF
ncbi:hypothetical protein EVA_11245 [gut metagenome]|uniref:Uncharacterized protein n=1 Tax=gut metagenome TaxID=749906 RepID=J9G1D7_9ZZZZ